MTTTVPPLPASASPGAARTATSGVAHRLAAVVEPIFGGTLPVRLRAWDGSQTGPADAPVIVLRTPDALRRLLFHPGELGLAQAYVSGELDVEGDLLDGLRRVWSQVRRTSGNGRLTPSVLARGVRTSISASSAGRWPRRRPRPI